VFKNIVLKNSVPEKEYTTNVGPRQMGSFSDKTSEETFLSAAFDEFFNALLILVIHTPTTENLRSKSHPR
jgi:hypothetical protein